ncbi:peptidase S8/S53 domain-containing protein [Mycena rebaudengoi]|nr:peptidase S8/S53 domain-containing protein [Mycena rebaudengoi]
MASSLSASRISRSVPIRSASSGISTLSSASGMSALPPASSSSVSRSGRSSFAPSSVISTSASASASGSASFSGSASGSASDIFSMSASAAASAGNSSSSAMSSSAMPSASSCAFPIPSSRPSKTKRTPPPQTNAAWGLARIAQSAALTGVGDDEDGPGGDLAVPKRAGLQDWSFPYDDTWGEGVVVYVVDSGVRKTHVEFEGRVEEIPGAETDDVCEGGGHGTGVASLIAGKTLGIARKATIVPVRVVDAANCKKDTDTLTADVVAGVNRAVEDYKNNRKCSYKGAIINISMTVRQTPASEQAYAAAIAEGMHVVVSAGNDQENQCFGGPAPEAKQRVKDVGQLIVGNMDFTDKPLDLGGSPGSNFGSCITLWAPGTSMNVASSESDTEVHHGGIDWSGTSYAAPMVAGTIAAMISSGGNKDPGAMRTLLLSKAVNPAGMKNLQDGSPDIILQSLLLSTTEQ